jgi:hypothetical protein
LKIPKGFGKNYFSLSAIVAYSTSISISAEKSKFNTLEDLQQDIIQQQQLNLTKDMCINKEGYYNG